MRPGFEQLFQIVQSVARTAPLEFMRVVLASADGEVEFLEVLENPAFRKELQEAYRRGLLPLGLLAWEMTAGSLQAKGTLFPWHRGDKTLEELFRRLCEDGVDHVKEELKRRGPPNDRNG
jgi:hypothetical protein